jgi:predicted nucleic acid-binding protein
LLFEIEHNPNLARQQFALEVLSKATIWVALDASLEKRAEELNTLGFKPLDALHLASAEAAQADYFCTCDDRLIKKIKTTQGLTIKAVSPIEAISEVENDSRD